MGSIELNKLTQEELSLDNESSRSPEMTEAIELLRLDPSVAFQCAHDHDEAAVAICDVPKGCVALPGLETQALCPQHLSSNGSFEGMAIVVDLDGGIWSAYFGANPSFVVRKDSETEALSFVELEYT